MADRYDTERERGWERDRERNSGRDWDRGRDWGRDVGGDRYAGRRDDWDSERNRERQNREGRYGEARYEDYGRRRGADEGWQDDRHSGSERSADYGNYGDWGRQGSWGTYGNRPDYSRENEYRDRGGDLHLPRSDDWGGFNTSRTNLFGTGGGGFGSGFASYGTGYRSYGGGSGSFGGGMSSYGGERERGRFAGRGPKGWQRSDDRIREDINERLTDHPHVDASEIDVQVKNGEVTLTGTVDDRQAKRIAEDLAENVSGVKEVHNQLRIQQQQYALQGSQSGQGGRQTSSSSGLSGGGTSSGSSTMGTSGSSGSSTGS